MATNNGFWQTYNRQLSYLDKAELARTGEVFNIVRVKEQTGGRYGDQWVIEVERETGELANISFTKAPNRNDKMELLREALGTMNQIPARVETFQTRNGQTGYDLADPNAEPSGQMPMDETANASY